MITRLLNEVNEKIETLNNLVQDKEYFKKLDERIEKVNNYAQKQQKEIERLNNIIKEVREWAKKYSCQFTNDDGELVVSEISFNIQARPCDLFKILDKGEKK